MKHIPLSPWQAMGTLPWQADFSRHIQQGLPLANQTPWFPASVPGCIYADLQKAGLIEDPYFASNSLHCEWVANRWWVYRTTFTLSEEDARDPLFLRFAGIDYAAKIYLNGHFLGRHEGMYLPFEAAVNDFVRPGEENVLVCVLEHAPFAAPQPGYTSKTRYLKARFNYKWDFAARLVSLGLYGEVTLISHPLSRIEHCAVRPVKEPEGWRVEVSLELENSGSGAAVVSCALDAPAGETVFQSEEKLALSGRFQRWRGSFPVEDPELWWPNGYGAQPLYPFRLAISGEDGRVCDAFSCRVGFRTLEHRTVEGRDDALPYLTVVNGKRIYLKGTNIVPLDCMTGAVSRERVREVLAAARDANVNYLRIWGGGHIESEDFYDAADEFGLMVLQEFPMSSSGCDDVPSRDPEFLQLLHRAAVYNMKRLGNHVSLTAWDGGNELTDDRYLGAEDHEGHPATYEDPTLAMLRGLAEALTPGIIFYPSSASGPNALLKAGDTGSNHDVHGPWGYGGVEGHYALYNASDSIVHGEFGCGGISSAEAIAKILPPEEQRLLTSGENRNWAHHSGGWDSYSFRELVMFGDLKRIPFSDYVKVNQFVQAEALRYALEANRRRQWANVGEMTWQFNEPWPNIQCSNILQYDGGKKLAYYAMRDAYAPVLASLRYEKLFYLPGDGFRAEVFLLNDRPDADYSVAWTLCGDGGETLLAGKFTGRAPEDLSQKAGEIAWTVPAGYTGGFSVRMEISCGEFAAEKEYLFLIADRDEPVELPAEDQLKVRLFNNRKLSSLLDAKRAPVGPVLRYVDRCWARALGK